MSDRSDTDAALAKERAAEDVEDTAQNAQLQKAKDDLAAAHAADVTEDAAYEAQIASLEKAVADLQAASKPPARPKPIGSSRGNYFGHVPDGLRIYLQPGEQPAKWSDNNDCNAVGAGQDCVFSKKVQDPQWLDSFLSTVPVGSLGKLRVVCGIHEPENDPITAQQYLAWVKADAAIVRKHPGMIPIQCLMNARDGKWVNYASPDIDEMWWDPYHGGVATVPKQYNPPATFLGPIEKACASVNKPWGLGETGSLATAADTNEKGRANWAVDLREYILGNAKCKGALWFNKGGNTMTQQLADAWYGASDLPDVNGC